MNKNSKVASKNRRRKADSSENDSSRNSRNLSALGGGQVRNPSSSGADDTYSEDESSSQKDVSEITKPKKVNNNIDLSKPNVRDLKRPSMQFLDKINLTEVESVIEDRGIIPINFGNEEKITKNKARRMSNKVRTTKYTWLSWAPLSLLMQFKRAANIYFLIISILTLMPFSPKTPASMIGTFAFVLFVTMLKEAFENYFRYISDKEANGRL